MPGYSFVDDAPKGGGYSFVDDDPKTPDKKAPSKSVGDHAVDAANDVKGIGANIAQGAGNLAAGAVRGAGSIGATLLAPFDMAKDAIAGKGLSLDSNRERRQQMDSGLQSMGAEPDSWLYKGGKLAGEIAGTAGAGGAIANGMRAVVPASIAAMPRFAQLVDAVASSGFKTGAPAATTLTGKAANLGTRAIGGAITGGATAGMVNPEDAGLGSAIGGALPIAAKTVGAIGRLAGRAVAGPVLPPEVKALAERAGQLGIDIPADRLTNSKPLNAMAAGLNYVPFSGRAATEAKMQSQLNQALSRTFGQDSDNVTMALRQAQPKLGGEFDRVLQAHTVKVDNQFLSDLAQAESRAGNELGSDGARIVKNQIDEIMEKVQNGEIDGQAAYNIKKTLDRIGKRNSPEAFYALDLKKDLMSALNRSLGTQEAAGFAATRQQYGNMLSLQKLAQNGAEGDVSIARVANMKNLNNHDLQELADISAQFLKSREGQHGAAQRAFAGLGLGSFAGLPALGGTIAGGRLANSVLNSTIVRNGLLGRPQPVPQGLLGEFYRAAPLLGVTGE